MAGPFYNCIKGTTAGTPGTGAFTPNAASSGFLAWSTAPTGWIGLVRYEDGSAWELQYSYWNGTTLSGIAFITGITTMTFTNVATLTTTRGEMLRGRRRRRGAFSDYGTWRG